MVSSLHEQNMNRKMYLVRDEGREDKIKLKHRKPEDLEADIKPKNNPSKNWKIDWFNGNIQKRGKLRLKMFLIIQNGGGYGEKKKICYGSQRMDRNVFKVLQHIF